MARKVLLDNSYAESDDIWLDAVAFFLKDGEHQDDWSIIIYAAGENYDTEGGKGRIYLTVAQLIALYENAKEEDMHRI